MEESSRQTPHTLIARAEENTNPTIEVNLIQQNMLNIMIWHIY